MIDGMERERAFKQVGAIDLSRRKRQSGRERFGEWSRRGWTGKPERVSEREASESTPATYFAS